MVGRGQSSPKIGFLEGNISIKVASASLVLSTILYSVAAACQGLHQLPFTQAFTLDDSTERGSRIPKLTSAKGIFSPSDSGNHYGRELPVFNVLIINVVLVSVRRSVVLISRKR